LFQKNIGYPTKDVINKTQKQQKKRVRQVDARESDDHLLFGIEQKLLNVGWAESKVWFFSWLVLFFFFLKL
jgi:hypothetical protein